jgi:membrane-associated phospholipid phosphatase
MISKSEHPETLRKSSPAGVKDGRRLQAVGRMRPRMNRLDGFRSSKARHVGSVTHPRQRVTKPVIPLLVLALASILVGGCVLLLGLLLPQHVRPRSTLGVARDLGRKAHGRSTFRRSLLLRLDPATATGLMLCAALAFILASGILIGILALLAREHSGLLSIDRSAAAWSHDHASGFATSSLNLITDLGTTWAVVALALILGTIEFLRTRNLWVAPFLVALLAGEGLLTVSVKDVVRRVRPTLNPVAHTLGPSFPSGHSATAAAFYAGAALLLGRHLRRTGRALLAAVAAGIAVAVAASRVLLDVHWLSDVIAGLALGWSWFLVCTIAFGGTLLRYGATANTLKQATATGAARPPTRN